jgi:hypothetical protein
MTEYKQVFRIHDPSDDNGSFENTERRFAWLKRKLRDYKNTYESIFPESWALEPMLAYEFCKETKLQLD